MLSCTVVSEGSAAFCGVLAACKVSQNISCESGFFAQLGRRFCVVDDGQSHEELHLLKTCFQSRPHIFFVL